MMIRRNLCGLLVLSLVLSVTFATENIEKAEKSEDKDLNEVKDEKTVSKRGILHHYSTHGHAHPAVVSATHYHLPQPVPVVARYPTFAKVPVIHKPFFSVAAPVPVAPPQPHYQIVPGGASVTSYSVNYPRALLPQPAIPTYSRPFVPAIGAPAVIPSVHQPIPHYHPAQVVPHYHPVSVGPHYHPAPVGPHYHPASVGPHYHAAPVVPHYHPAPAVSHYHPASVVPQYQPSFVSRPMYPSFFAQNKPVIPVAVPVHGIRYPKIPVYFNQPKPVFPQFAPNPQPTPSFVPVAVPANPPPAAQNPGIEESTIPSIAQDTNMVFTQQFPIPLQPTQPTFVQPTFMQQPMLELQPETMKRPGSVQMSFFPQQPGATQEQPTFIQPTLTLPPQPTRPFIMSHPSFNMPHAPARPSSQQPSLHIRPHGMRPIMMMPSHHPQPTQPTLTNKAPYNYHAPAVPFNDQASSTNNIVSGHGQMSSQLMQQLALYQQQQHHQQYVQQQQESK